MSFKYLTKTVMAKAIEMAERRVERGSFVLICCEVCDAGLALGLDSARWDALAEVEAELTRRGIDLGGDWLRTAADKGAGVTDQIANERRIALMREIMELLPE